MENKGLIIIFEGCDGSGKSALIKSTASFIQQAGFDITTIHSPGSIGHQGMSDFMDREYYNLELGEHTARLFDRIPPISENIYGPVLRNKSDLPLIPYFINFIHSLSQHNAYLVYCNPGLREIKQNIKKLPQMVGVIDKVDLIYDYYRTRMEMSCVFLDSLHTLNRFFLYNYTWDKEMVGFRSWLKTIMNIKEVEE
jgi:hypothetical protein